MKEQTSMSIAVKEQENHNQMEQDKKFNIGDIVKITKGDDVGEKRIVTGISTTGIGSKLVYELAYDESTLYEPDCLELVEPSKAEDDPVNHPAHYTSHPSGVECIEITRHYCFAIGNAIKYLWRAGLKQDADKDSREKEIEDLEKAVWYINDRIKQLKGECKSVQNV